MPAAPKLTTPMGLPDVEADIGCEIPPLDDTGTAVECEAVGIIGAGRMGSQIGGLIARRLGRPAVLCGNGDDVAAVSDCDIVIECVTEELAAKQQVFRALERVVRPAALLLTNTSSLLVGDIAADLDYPERIAGLHFFQPVAKMELVEVAAGPRTLAATTNAVVEFAERLSKTVVVCADRPGLVVNRLLTLVVSQALAAVANGTPVNIADRALAELGLPLPAQRLVDLIGEKVFSQVAVSLRAQLGERFRALPALSGFDGPLPTGAIGHMGTPVYDADQLIDALTAALATEIQLLLNEKVVASLAEIRKCLRLGASWSPPPHIL